jgi:PPP family 3-phenylpropionic acid transporter
MPKIEGHAHSKKMNFAPLFKGKELLLLIGVLATAQFAYGYYMNFFPTYLTGELNAPSWLWGTNVLLTTISEAPFYIWFDTLFKRFGMKKVVIFILALTIVRYVLLALFTNFAGILIIGFITGAASVSLLYSVNFYVNKNVEPSLKASAQTMVYAIGVGVPRMLSSLIGGFMTESIGTNFSMIISSLVVVIGLVIYILYSTFKKKETKEIC